MKFNSPAQEKAYIKAIKHKFKAVAFDIDGTLTNLAKITIPQKLLIKLGDLIGKVPIAICSGRDIDHIKNKVEQICSASYKEKSGREKYFVICENGASSYAFNCKTNEYKEIFRIPWPDEVISMDAMVSLLKKKFPFKLVVKAREGSIILHFHAWLYVIPKLIFHMSALALFAIKHLLKKEGLDKYFEVQDSGIGNIIIPKESGKGKAIKRWSEYLGIALKDIAVIGDMPGDGKNDSEFLCGRYGVAFTVGKSTDRIYPLPVYNKEGRRLYGPHGTLELLSTLDFN